MSRYLVPRLPLCLLPSLLLLVAVGPAPAALAGDSDWKPVDPAHLAMKTPAVERDADAEAIFWEVRADDGDAQDFVLTNYIRIKVFTERGRETQSAVELPFVGGMKVKDVAARTIKPSGEIVELKKEDIFEKTIVKAGGLKLKAKTFALPAVEPGAIVEYRWREVYADDSAQYARMQFQRDIPVQTLTYSVKPSAHFGNARAMRFQTFQMEVPKFEKGKNGFYTATVANVPAFREEPRMPPEDSVRRWMLLYYTPDVKSDPAGYWKHWGQILHGVFKERIKVNDDIKRAAAEIVGDAATPEQKLERIYDFCRLKIKNLSDDASGLTEDDRERLKRNEKPADTLKRAQGTASDIDELFAALALAAGFDARLALVGDRSRIFFDPNFADIYFLLYRGRSNVAVRVGEGWRFFEPSDTYVPFGMLAWQAEEQQALISDPKEGVFYKTPLAPPAKSLEKRTAKLKLLEDGTLEGEVVVEYTGHAAHDKKEYNDDDSPQRREETLRLRVKEQMSTAELSDVRVENVTDPHKPFVYAYKVRVPGYAQRTGKRLFLQPAFFQRGLGPVFSAATRRNEIYFHYPWSEDDTVEIELPEGFALDNADAPEPFEADKISKYDVKIGVTNDGRRLIYRRSFFFGGGNRLRFPVGAYTALKGLFDELHKRDNHTITLKAGAAAANTSN
jgi:hypothetical protein